MVKTGYIDIEGMRLFTRDTATNLPPMLCLHGRWGRGETWADVIARYGDRYRIIAPDQRGHGLSAKPMIGYRTEDLARDAHELLRVLACGPIIAVGHSMGGRVAAHLAAMYPDSVKALAILDETADGSATVFDIDPENDEVDDGLTMDWPTPYPTREAAEKDLAERYPRESNQKYFLDSLTETEAGFDFMFSRRAMTALRQANCDWYELLPKIKCPTLFMRAAESWCLPAESAAKMRGMIKDCTYVEVSDSDHMVYADNPKEFYKAFDAFLARV